MRVGRRKRRLQRVTDLFVFEDLVALVDHGLVLLGLLCGSRHHQTHRSAREHTTTASQAAERKKELH